MIISYEDQIVLVTGATRGIGAALADAFENCGARLILTGTKAEQCQSLNDYAATHGQRRTYLPANFNDNQSLNDLIDYISNEKRIDVCVNNAAINILNSIDEITEANIQEMIATDLRAPLLISQAAAKVMTTAGYGRIVNVSSIWATIGKPRRTLYSMMKSSVHGLTIGSSVELAQAGILVNTVSPGFVLTDLTRQNNSEVQMAEFASQVPLGRLAEPSEIAQLILFLASSRNTYITGQNIIIDGGFTNV